MATRVEKAALPLVDDIMAAAALSVIALLDDDRSRPGGEWFDAVEAWNGRRIRKIMRRGRASAWGRAQMLPGVTASYGTAEVRAFVPGPVDAAPTPLAKLQIQSTPLDDPGRMPSDPGRPQGATGPTLTIAVTPEVEMSWGKLAAQCAHAGQRAWEAESSRTLEAWAATGRSIQVLRPAGPWWPDMVDATTVHVHDGGFTEIPAGTLTAVAAFR